MTVHQVLHEKLNGLLQTEERLQGHLRNAGGRAPETLEDWSGILQSDEVVEALDEAALDEVHAVIAALKRLETGAYGYCIRCGESIPRGRLEAIPETATCVDCAAAE